jgi:3-oxoacyl-[acyl-carrier protein] reductase
MTFERWRSTLAACLDSVFLTCRAFLRHVKETKSGNIVIVASTAGVIGEAGYADYAAAKGALVSGFVKSLKNEIVEIAPRGRVNVVAPGWTAVERTSDRLEDVAFVDKITRTMALRKVARPEDVARVVVALASDEISGHVTGEVVAVAGGIEGRVLHD